VIATILFVSAVGIALLFMMVFLRALVRESLIARAPVSNRRSMKDQRSKKSLTIVMLERYRSKDLAA